MNRRGETHTLAAILAIVMMAWIASGYRVQQQSDALRDVAGALDLHIPFNFRVSMGAGPYCDPLSVELLMLVDSAGQELEFRWRVMDGDLVQLECGNFYDLYYRCDAPRCLDLRVVTQDYSGRFLSERRGHVCIE